MNAPVRRSVSRFLVLPLVLLVFALAAHAAPVLMISIDGMKPEYITQADAHGLKIPYLRTLVSDGAYADGVTGVWPTVTYPSHTTLITGAWPAEHGIYNNLEFDPEQHFNGDWYWYAAQIRAPTLWQAAHAAGLKTASVGWPVTVGADIDWLIPEYWRTMGERSNDNSADQLLMASLAHPAHLIDELASATGPYMNGNDTDVDGDAAKTLYSLEILRRYKPAFMTIHLSSLDETEHMHGPFSPEADQDLEALDGMVASLAQRALDNDPNAVIIVVSDHGFLTLTHGVNLLIPFLQAGLIQATMSPASKTPVITSWKAQPWMAGGMAAIMLHDPNDHETGQKVHEMLLKLAADPENGIAQVLDHDELVKRGGFPDAAFLVVLKQGYYTAPATSGALITPIPGTKGSHGFSPEFPEMRSSFFAVGAGIARHRDLGLVDMRQIAPTVAGILGVSLPTAKAAPLNVAP
ncbi:MAG: ectonucleotide pyrophosphatase/phosphodiesterase [Terracidiphilus sp.]